MTSVARAKNGLIEGCNKARSKPYFNRVLAKFTGRSSSFVLAPWRHLAWLLRFGGILRRHREFRRGASRGNAGRRSRWLRRGRLRDFLGRRCRRGGHGL